MGCGLTLDFYGEESTSYRCGEVEITLFCNQRKSQSAEQEKCLSLCLAHLRGPTILNHSLDKEWEVGGSFGSFVFGLGTGKQESRLQICDSDNEDGRES